MTTKQYDWTHLFPPLLIVTSFSSGTTLIPNFVALTSYIYIYLLILMASLPSGSLTATLKQDPELWKNKNSSPNLSVDKRPSISYYATGQYDGNIELKSPDFKEALSLIKEGKTAQPYYYVPILQECMQRNSASDVEIIHAHIVKAGMHQDLLLLTNLVNVYGKCGSIQSARKIFDKMERRNVVAWTTLMTCYVHNSQPHLAIQIFLKMLESGSYPTNLTLGIALNACIFLESYQLGKQIHAYIIKYRIEHDTSIGNSLCSMYSKLGHLEYAIKAFEGIEAKNVISWTAVISACGDNGNAALGSRFFLQMLVEGVEPNEFTLTSVLSLCCTMLSLGLGQQIHSLCIKLGYESVLSIKNSIMYLYLKCRCIDEAQKLFDEIDDASLVTWNAMIAGRAQTMDLTEDILPAYRNGIEALGLFLKLNRSALRPDSFTFSSALTVCSSLVGLEQGEQIHAQTIKTGTLSDVVVGTALVNMYIKCGSMTRATKAFLEMSTRTLISWTTIITGFAQHGQTQQALQLFQDMRLAGVRPNQITFVGVIAACGDAGMVDEALHYFDIMQKEYRIKPVMDHYECLVNMFARLGRLDEAISLIEKMEFEPNECVLLALISGSGVHGRWDVGLYAAEKLLKLKPLSAETYKVLQNLYLSTKKWEEASNMKALMREREQGNLKDWSWVCIRSNIHLFEADDQSHLDRTDIYKLLEDWITDISEINGYSSLEIEENNRFSLDVVHSEILALAFGFLNTRRDAPIRIIKRYSMSKNSHNFAKHISLLISRKIVIRDGKRIHKFVNGRCSCGDFWGVL